MTPQRPLRILALDDSEGDVKLMERTLRAGDLTFALSRVETREAFERELRAGGPDIILVDYRLPHFDGLSALRLAKKLLPGVPVIIVTGSLSDELAIEFLQEGAADYILKDRRSRLAVAVERAVAEARLRAERQSAEERYRRLFQESGDAIALFDCGDGRITEANPPFERMAGQGARALVGVPVWDLGAPSDRPRLRAAISAACGKSSPFVVHFDLPLPDGGRQPVELLGMPGSRGEQTGQVICRPAPVPA